MFEALKRFVDDLAGDGRGAKPFDENDYRLAVVALLIHVANADGAIDTAERRRVVEVIEKRFGLDGAQASRLLADAEQSDREAVDFFHFTSVLKRSLDDEGRQKVIGLMWDVAFADGAVDEIEENVVSRVADLLGVSPRDRVTLKQRAARTEAEAEPLPAGPWTHPATADKSA